MVLTLLICVAPALFFGWMFFRVLPGNDTVLTVIWGMMTALFAAILMMGVICTPYKYILTSTHLIIKRRFRDVAVPLREIKLIRLMTPDDKKGMMRMFGAEGAFGLFGHFRTDAHPKLIVYARRYDHRSIIITDRKKYVIAPDDLQLIHLAAQQIDQTEADSPTGGAPAKKWYQWVFAAGIAAVLTFTYLSYKEPAVSFDSNAFKLKGIFGVNIPLSKIAQADTISWREAPAISIRTGGISLFKVHRGRFRTADGDQVRLNIHRGTEPVIRMVDQNGLVYYINRKNPVETRQIFNNIYQIINPINPINHENL
jgi:hypothetical protein